MTKSCQFYILRISQTCPPLAIPTAPATSLVQILYFTGTIKLLTYLSAFSLTQLQAMLPSSDIFIK